MDYEDPGLADTAVSTTLTSLNGVGFIAERAMWWPGPSPASWQEAHNAAGSTAAGSRWVLAEGEVGGPASIETYILIANTSSRGGRVRVRLFFEDGTTAENTYTLEPNSRFNVPVGFDFPQAVGRKCGAVVESLDTPPIELVVERAVYESPGGQRWAAGSDALGTLTVSTVDSDSDGVSDVKEVAAGTNPLAPDTDGDGVPDGEEVARGTDPAATETATVMFDPVNGEENVAVSRETIARFSQPLAANVVVDANVLYATLAGQKLPARIDVSSDRRKATLFYASPLPAASRVRVTLVGGALATAAGELVDVDGDGMRGWRGDSRLRDHQLVADRRHRCLGVRLRRLQPDGQRRQPPRGRRNHPGRRVPAGQCGDRRHRILHPAQHPAPEFFVHIDGTTADERAAGVHVSQRGQAVPQRGGADHATDHGRRAVQRLFAADGDG